MTIDVNELLQQFSELAMNYGLKLIAAIAVYIIGKWASGLVASTLLKIMQSRGIDQTVTQFTKNIAYYALFVITCIAALGQLGIQTASFVAIIGAAGLAVGLALQGSLANFASGVLLILFRPIKVGDFVEVAGVAGVVNEISIFCTIILTPDNKTITVTNSAVMGGNIINYSTQAERRIDLVVGVSYSSNLDQVKSELQSIVAKDQRVLNTEERKTTIAVLNLGDSSVDFVVRPWVKSGDYWPTRFDLTENIKKRFDEVGIEIPFPQMDIHTQR